MTDSTVKSRGRRHGRPDQNRKDLMPADKHRPGPRSSRRAQPYEGGARRPWRRFTEAEQVAMTAAFTDLYNQGHSLQTIADQHGCSYGTVHRYLSNAGVQMRSRGGAHGKPAVRPIPTPAPDRRAGANTTASPRLGNSPAELGATRSGQHLPRPTVPA
ncbi:helix-turn-helix domain-containing protein [Actinoplanes sp. NPDC000266]